MISFKNDYSTGMHPAILEAISTSNLEVLDGYGDDQYCINAKQKIKNALKTEKVDVHFLVGGTQTNLVALSSFLRPHEAVIACDSAHICVHEAGAIEATGHKIITVKNTNGKLNCTDLAKVLKAHNNDEHMVKPRLVKISNSSEIGTVYSKEELQALSVFCKTHDLLFYMDGARLGSALSRKDNDLKLSDLPNFFDAFYIGGTKNGALMGEALVIVNPNLKKDFRYMQKQKGARLAKGRFLGLQFDALFSVPDQDLVKGEEYLFLQLAAHANKMADYLRENIKDLGYAFLTDSPTNQIFPILPAHLVERLQSNFKFYVWQDQGQTDQAIRLVTSWSTQPQEVEAFIAALKG